MLLSAMQTDVDFLKESDSRLTKRIDSVCQKLDSLKTWMMGIMAGLIITFITYFLK
jgi:hypothetical protein